MWKFSQPAQRLNIHTKSVRQASMVQRDAPLSFLVTLMPKKLKKAMDITLAAVVICSCLDLEISFADSTPPGAHLDKKDPLQMAQFKIRSSADISNNGRAPRNRITDLEGQPYAVKWQPICASDHAQDRQKYCRQHQPPESLQTNRQQCRHTVPAQKINNVIAVHSALARKITSEDLMLSNLRVNCSAHIT